jgi:hypothetical protein
MESQKASLDPSQPKGIKKRFFVGKCPPERPIFGQKSGKNIPLNR